MSLHITCKKCGEWLGGIWPNEGKGYDWNRDNIYKPFFMTAAADCEEEGCGYKDGSEWG